MGTESNLSSEFQIKTGRDVARYLIYFSKMLSRWSNVGSVSIVNISGTKLYREHKTVCDKALFIQNKYGIDFVKYLKFFLSKYRFNSENVEKIVDVRNLMWYANESQIKAKHKRVYEYVLKSVDYVVSECIAGGYVSASEYLKALIQENKLGEKYLSGKISGYYLAGIKNLSKIVRKMNLLNRETLKEVVDNQDKLVSDMQDAFTYMKSSRISVVSFTNDKLMERLSSR